MDETTKTIGEWADSTFGPPRNIHTAFARAGLEWAELHNAIAEEPENLHRIAGEVADTIIALERLMYFICCDTQLSINSKMSINRGRKWKVDRFGNAQHVKDSETSESTRATSSQRIRCEECSSPVVCPEPSCKHGLLSLEFE